MMDMGMYMYFWTGNQLTWLFYNAESTTGAQYFGGLICTFLVGVLIEALTYLRNYVYIKS